MIFSKASSTRERTSVGRAWTCSDDGCVNILHRTHTRLALSRRLARRHILQVLKRTLAKTIVTSETEHYCPGPVERIGGFGGLPFLGQAEDASDALAT
jgi:hypothetical protein